MTAEQALLPLEDKAFQAPRWCHRMGYATSGQVYNFINKYAGLIVRAQEDGIENVAPILLALRSDPQAARIRVGKGVWKKIHHSDLYLNIARANVLLRSRITLPDLIEFPPGSLREVLAKIRATNETVVIVAGRISKNRTEFREAVMLVKDAIRMGGEPKNTWSLRRLREEHDRRALALALAKSDPTPWYEPWSCEVDGFLFSLLRSHADFAAEGATQRHCVASYARDAKARSCLVMRIEGRERATVRFGGCPIKVQEVRARFNGPVSKACRRACEKICAEYLESERKGDAQ